MKISDYSFHDATILEVKEFPENQVLEFLLDYPVDWDNNQFEQRVLRFNGVTSYSMNSILFDGNPTILEIQEVGKSVLIGDRNRIDVNTNSGKRTIEYMTCELVR